jgi:serine/threonine protein kinase
LGSGTYAEVYAGTYLGTDVAVKCFNNSDKKCLKAYFTELEVMKELRTYGSHPNIIHIFGGF